MFLKLLRSRTKDRKESSVCQKEGGRQCARVHEPMRHEAASCSGECKSPAVAS